MVCSATEPASEAFNDESTTSSSTNLRNLEEPDLDSYNALPMYVAATGSANSFCNTQKKVSCIVAVQICYIVVVVRVSKFLGLR